MNEEDKKPEGAPDSGDSAENQKSDKSPEELMGQVANGDESLEAGAKKSAVDAMADESTSDREAAPARPKLKGFKGILSRVNIYLLLFIFIMVLAAASFGVTYVMNKREQEIRLTTTELTEQTLEELKTSDAVVGDPQQILTIESNAFITGKVVMRDTLDVAGALKIGGPLSIPSITAGGNGNFGSLETNDFQAAGNVSIGGVLDVTSLVTLGNNLSVAGDITGGGRLDIGGSVTIGGNLNINGTLSAQGINFGTISINHINISGGSPTISAGGAAGGGATASLSGTDTAGTATINTGGGTGTGILATLVFSESYNTANPHPVLTPNGPGCASIAFYVTNISATQFAIATASAPPAGATCRFNYVVIN